LVVAELHSVVEQLEFCDDDAKSSIGSREQGHEELD
jgi:hypothetical protein